MTLIFAHWGAIAISVLLYRYLSLCQIIGYEYFDLWLYSCPFSDGFWYEIPPGFRQEGCRTPQENARPSKRSWVYSGLGSLTFYLHHCIADVARARLFHGALMTNILSGLDISHRGQ